MVSDDSGQHAAVKGFGRQGLTVGPIAFGGASIGNLYTEVDDATALDAVDAAWEAGVRYFDTAPHYGLGESERRLGQALRRYSREDFIVSTKVGRLLKQRSEQPDSASDDGSDELVRVFDFSRDGVMRSLESSLQRLGLDRVDVVLVHDPDDHYSEALDGAFPALEELRAQGVIRSYGAGMNQSAMLADFIRRTDLDIVMLAGRFTLLEQGALEDLLPVALERGVSVIAAGVFNSGILAKSDPLPGAYYNYAPAPEEVYRRAVRIAETCAEHQVTLPQAAIHFPALHPAVSTVCLGVRSRGHVMRNAQQYSSPVPPALWRDLADQGLIDERVIAHGLPDTR
ncbi:MAG: aldo/keto reductase [Microcella sp.]